jgi:DNA-binding GntR family transcriptional regulator
VPRNQALAGEPGRQHAFEQLRRTIQAGDMAPGQRLVEEELAGLLEVTRASVRAALIDLTAAGLVERIPNRGARVRVVTKDEAIAITECRMALESLCARKAAEGASDEHRQRFRELGDQMTDAVAHGEPVKYSALNRTLHALIIDVSGQQIAADLIDRLNGQFVRHRFQLALTPGRPQRSLPQHLAIIDAIAAGEPDRAEHAMRGHLRSVIEALREQAPG